MVQKDNSVAMYLMSENQIADLVERIIEGVRSGLCNQSKGSDQSKGSEPDDALMTYKEVSLLLGSSKTTIWRYVNAGKLTPIRLSCRSVKFRKSEVLKAVEEWKQE